MKLVFELNNELNSLFARQELRELYRIKGAEKNH